MGLNFAVDHTIFYTAALSTRFSSISSDSEVLNTFRRLFLRGTISDSQNIAEYKISLKFFILKFVVFSRTEYAKVAN